MEDKKNSKKIIIILSFIIVVLISTIGIFIFKDKIFNTSSTNVQTNNVSENNVTNNSTNNGVSNTSNSVVENATTNTSNNKVSNSSNEIKYLNMSIEDKLYCIAKFDDFTNGKNLTTEQYLNVAYVALNSGYVTIKNDLGQDQYTEAEIKSIVYTIFGVKLTENKSIPGLTYNNGIYEFMGADGDFVPIIKNLAEDSAAGTMYSEFDLYFQDIDDHEEYQGKYLVAIGQNTDNGERYITSKKAE